METFKAWKELIKAVKGISSAIEGEDSKGGSGEVDNTNYLLQNVIVNKNFDNTKLTNTLDVLFNSIPTKVGDILNQDGVDIINDIFNDTSLSFNKDLTVGLFWKNSPNGNILVRTSISLTKKADNAYGIAFGTKNGTCASELVDKITLETSLTYYVSGGGGGGDPIE